MYVIEQTWGEVYDILLPKGPPVFLLGFPPHLEVCFACRQRKDVSQCLRLVKRKGIIYLKVIQT